MCYYFLGINLGKNRLAAEKQHLVAKSNRLVEASYRLTLIEQQLILYAICRCRDDGKGFKENDPIRISAKEFAEKFHIDKSNVYSQLESAAKLLNNRKVLIHGTDEVSGFPSVTHAGWISYATYVPRAGVVEFAFHSKVVPYITRLEGEYTTYRLEKIGRMTSSYAVRIYELLLQYQSIGERCIAIDDLKSMLWISDEYPRLFDFKRYVIEPAIKQINEHTDLRVSYDQRKNGRNVTHLVFKIRAREEAKPEKQTKQKKRPAVDREYVEKHARPGESYDQAFRRLLEDAGQQRMIA